MASPTRPGSRQSFPLLVGEIVLAGDPSVPDVVEDGLTRVAGEAADDLRGLDQRVVDAVGHGAVPRCPPNPQPPPGHALLGHGDGDGGTSLGSGHRAPRFGDDVVAVHRVGGMFGEPAGTLEAARLLVGHGGVHQAAAGRNPDLTSSATAAAMVQVRLSMSMAPRPHTSPSTSSPPKGSRRQSAGVTGTTSVWPSSRSDGACGSEPSTRTTSDSRPGVGSYVSKSAPASSR